RGHRLGQERGLLQDRQKFLAVPTVAPRHSKFNDLNCQTALTAAAALKAFCYAVKLEIVRSVKRWVFISSLGATSMYVRFTPKSGYSSMRMQCPLWAKCGHHWAERGSYATQI